MNELYLLELRKLYQSDAWIERKKEVNFNQTIVDEFYDVSLPDFK